MSKTAAKYSGWKLTGFCVSPWVVPIDWKTGPRGEVPCPGSHSSLGSGLGLASRSPESRAGDFAISASKGGLLDVKSCSNVEQALGG